LLAGLCPVCSREFGRIYAELATVVKPAAIGKWLVKPNDAFDGHSVVDLIAGRSIGFFGCHLELRTAGLRRQEGGRLKMVWESGQLRLRTYFIENFNDLVSRLVHPTSNFLILMTMPHVRNLVSLPDRPQ
jgi:hypothetical protein